VTSAADYHADPAPAPSLTASIANVLINESPAHARAAHPRLNPNFVRVEEDKFSLGTVMHQLLLEGIDAAHVVHAYSWRTAAAKEARDEARAHGRVPLLTHQHDEAKRAVEAAQEQIAAHPAQPPLFTDGKPEQTIMWEESGGVWCRARLDWRRDDDLVIDDLKTCGQSADPRRWQRTMIGIGAATQARFYCRGIKALTGREPDFRFVVVETHEPYAVSVVSLAPSLEQLADAQVEYAIRTWRRCIDTGEWPGYDQRVAHVEAPGWMEADWFEREAMETPDQEGLAA
jgi:hypothetical protein